MLTWILIGLLFGLFSGLLMEYKNTPKGYKKIVSNMKEAEDKRHSILRDGFNKRKIPENLDAIIIGSGIGGLSLGAFLSRVGKKVLVLEQHYIAGGCCHAFDEGGYEFDTGIHYIGNFQKRKSILDFITDKKLEWDQLGREDDKKVYDEIVIGQNRYPLRAGKENIIADLKRWFPTQKDAIDEYFYLVTKIANKDLHFVSKVIQNKLLKKIIKTFFCIDYYLYANMTASQVIDKIITNKDLKAVLTAQFADYGCSPAKISFAMHCGVVNHYLEGGYYPRGGSNSIAEKIIPVIEKSGGRVLVRKAVKSVLVENNMAYGVEMENGEKVYAKKVISDAGIRNTLNNLLPPGSMPEEYYKLLEEVKPSISYFYSFIGLKGSQKELNLPSRNFWVFPNIDMDNVIEEFGKDPIHFPHRPPMFIVFPSAKDSKWDTRFPEKSTALVLSILPYELFEKWQDEKCMKRDEEYNELKNAIGERLIKEGLLKFYPELEDKIEYKNFATALTNKHYLNTDYGECLGLDHCDKRFTSDILEPVTPIKNFYFTGQDIATGGFAGGLVGGLLCANSVLGYGTIMDILLNKDLIKDLEKI